MTDGGTTNTAPDATTGDRRHLPGSDGEKRMQERLDTVERADAFYDGAMQESLNQRMREFLAERRTAFVGCTSPRGSTRVRVRSHEDVVTVEDENRITWKGPADSELLERAADADYATLLTVDWEETTVGLHVNGSVGVERGPDGPRGVIDVEEAYIHCAKHLPRLEERTDADWQAGSVPTDGGIGSLHREFISERLFFMLGTADEHGDTDISPRFGPRGFVQLTEHGLAYPEFRGNGVHASLGNMLETEQACFTFLDWWQTGQAVSVEGSVTIREEAPPNAEDLTDCDRTKVWVEMSPDRVELREPDVPRYTMGRFDPPWGTDDVELKKAGFFTGGD